MKRIVLAAAMVAFAAGAVFGVDASMTEYSRTDNSAATMVEYSAQIVAGAYKK